MTIPAADEQRFFATYYPRLRRRVPLRSTRGDVALPELQPPTLLLRADRRSAGEIAVQWQWRYRIGDTSRLVALHAGEVHDLPDDGRRGAPDRDDRDAAAEHRIRRAVESVLARLPGTLATDQHGVRIAPSITLRDLDAITFTTDVLPRLDQLDGVEVEVSGAVADYREVAGDTRIEFTDATDGTARDWFDLAVRVTVGTDEVPFEPLFVALATGRTHLLLDDGRWLDLDRPELHELARVIAEARAVHDQPRRTVRVSRYQAAIWADLEEVGQVHGPAADWQRRVRALVDLDPLAEETPPAGLNAQLRPYQLAGLRWLAVLFDNGLGGVLADDMGLGKTLQTLALILRARQAAPGGPPFLIVAPTTVMSNWQAESARFAPSLRTTVITETFARRRVALAQAVAGCDVVITSYTLFRLEHDAYSALPWAGLVLDEAQAAKNHQSRNYSCAKELDAPFKLAITGTPMENHLGELWSLLSIAAPGLFPTPARFEEFYRRPIERDRNAERLDSLRRRIRPVLLRRTKDQVAADLPDKQEQVLEVELHPRHRHAYETLLHRERQKVLGLLDDLEGNRFEILRSLTLLRQASLDIALVDPDVRSVPATKLDVLVELLAGIGADGHRTLVFSQFTRFLRAAQHRLDAAGHPVLLPRRVHPRPAGGHRAVQDRHRTGVPAQPQGGRRRAESDGGGLLRAARSVVEPGDGGAGHRPHPPHRPDPQGAGLPDGCQGHDRGEGGRAQGPQGGAVRRRARATARSPPLGSRRPTSARCSTDGRAGTGRQPGTDRRRLLRFRPWRRTGSSWAATGRPASCSAWTGPRRRCGRPRTRSVSHAGRAPS